MKKYAFSFSFQQDFSEPVSKHGFILRCTPGTYPFQRTYAHKLTVKPFAALSHITDVHGNEMCSGTIDKAHEAFSFTASGFVLSSKYIMHEPMDRLYLYPTKETQPVQDMAQLTRSTASIADDWARAKALCDLTHRLLRFTPDTKHRTAAEAFAAGSGDAKDCAQVFIALCRLSGIAARCVSGLAVGIPRSHAWAEVYCGSAWRALDPSAGVPVEDGYLKIAHGPDYDACTAVRYCYRDSTADFTSSVHVSVTEHIIRTRDTVPHA